MHRLFILLTLVSLTLLPGPGMAVANAQAGPAKVDPRVWADTEGGRQATFLVVLTGQADARQAAAQATGRAAVAPRVYGALRASAAGSQPAVAAQVQALGLPYRAYWIVNALAVTGDRAAVTALAARPDVKAIEPDRPFRVPLEGPAPGPAGPASAGSTGAPAAPRGPLSIPWNLAKINAPAVWNLGFTGQGIVYANADTGVQWDHPALKPHYRGWDGSQANHNYNWWDAIHTDLSGGGPNTACPFNSPAPCDDYGHGTHTMGIGIGDDGQGNQVGVAPGAKWIACRNMDRGVGRPSTYIECLQFLMAPTDLNGQNPDPSKHADVISNSYGCPLGDPPYGEACVVDSLKAAVDNVAAAGIFMAVSAGNSGPACSTVTAPPAYESSVITVGSTESGDGISVYSSRGPVTVDGSNRRKPDVAAPGTSVRSSYPLNSYASLSGTSMAAPHVAGAVALLWSAFPALRNQVEPTQALLQASAVHLFDTEGCGEDTATQVPNNASGYGRIDALAAYGAYANVPTMKYYLPLFAGER